MLNELMDLMSADVCIACDIEILENCFLMSFCKENKLHSDSLLHLKNNMNFEAEPSFHEH